MMIKWIAFVVFLSAGTVVAEDCKFVEATSPFGSTISVPKEYNSGQNIYTDECFVNRIDSFVGYTGLLEEQGIKYRKKFYLAGGRIASIGFAVLIDGACKIENVTSYYHIETLTDDPTAMISIARVLNDLGSCAGDSGCFWKKFQLHQSTNMDKRSLGYKDLGKKWFRKALERNLERLHSMPMFLNS